MGKEICGMAGRVHAHLSFRLSVCHHADQQAKKSVRARCILDQDALEPVTMRGFYPL